MATRLVRGKVTVLHRRTWAALVRLAEHFPGGALDALHKHHNDTGAHRAATTTAFPRWVPPM